MIKRKIQSTTESLKNLPSSEIIEKSLRKSGRLKDFRVIVQL